MVTAAKPSPAKPRILVVEDEGLIALDIQRTLEDLGYSVAGPAGSGAEAFACAAQSPVDVVLMDIRIRGELDCIQVARKLWEQYQIPVVYLTAQSDGETRERAERTEPCGYVLKPFSTGSMKASIEMALQRQRNR